MERQSEISPTNKDNRPKVFAIIVAGGKGTRFGTDLPKQFANLDDKPVLLHTLMAMRKVIPAENIVTVLSTEMTEYWRRTCRDHGVDCGPLAIGGETRWHSVRNGLSAIDPPRPDDIVLVHDGARPFLSEIIIQNVIKAIEEGHDGAIPVVEVTDSVRQIEGSGSRALERSTLRAVQTPQAFRAATLTESFSLPYSPSFTDEASMLEHAGYSDIALVNGDRLNFKITHPADLALALYLIKDK